MPSVRTLLRFAFILALAAVFWLAVMPAPDIVRIVEWQDKIEHAVLFAALALLGVAAWPRAPLRLGLFLLVYGAAIEVAQAWTGYRFGDLWDWLADAAGLTVLLPFAVRRHRETS